MFFFSFTNCKFDEKDEKKAQENVSLVNVNKYLVLKNKEKIESYIERHKWEMRQTETGLWHMIYSEGEGKSPKKGETVAINYELSLLDGTICYKSVQGRPKFIEIGHDNIESGVQQGLLLLKEGSKAKFILMPHLAHGLIGDEDKIPPMSVVIYDVELVKIYN